MLLYIAISISTCSLVTVKYICMQSPGWEVPVVNHWHNTGTKLFIPNYVIVSIAIVSVDHFQRCTCNCQYGVYKDYCVYVLVHNDWDDVMMICISPVQVIHSQVVRICRVSWYHWTCLVRACGIPLDMFSESVCGDSTQVVWYLPIHEIKAILECVGYEWYMEEIHEMPITMRVFTIYMYVDSCVSFHSK